MLEHINPRDGIIEIAATGDKDKGRAVFCTPTHTGPYPAYLASIAASAPLLRESGWGAALAFEFKNAYISVARAVLLRKALNSYADVIVFIDHDVSWEPQDLLRLIETEGDVVAGTYRYKTDEEERYMGWMDVQEHAIQQRADGCFRATHIPAGFMKITRNAVNRFMEAYPHLVYGEKCLPHVDLFNHGAEKGIWWGEDYAFSQHWLNIGGDIWLIPDLNLTHNDIERDGTAKAYPGNFADFVRRKNFKVRKATA